MNAILLGGVVLAAGLTWPGLLLRYTTTRYHWISGYNTASREEQQKYDIEGLSHHLGNGLIVLGVCLLGATIALGLGRNGWLLGCVAAFLFFAAITVVGGQRFTPAARSPAEGESGHTVHRFVRWLLPERAYRALEAGTRQWQIECSCGNAEDYWDAGGIRYKAVGERSSWYACKRCGKTSIQKIRRKPS